MTAMEPLPAMLDRLRALNAAQDEDFPQVLEPAGFVAAVPTLAPGRRNPITAMLRARFDYAGTWTHAAISQHWLSVRQMEAVWTDAGVQHQLANRRKNWHGSLLDTHDPALVSLLGIDPVESEETYLVWPGRAGVEPQVVLYAGELVKEFQDFRAYVSWLLREA